MRLRSCLSRASGHSHEFATSHLIRACSLSKPCSYDLIKYLFMDVLNLIFLPAACFHNSINLTSIPGMTKIRLNDRIKRILSVGCVHDATNLYASFQSGMMHGNKTRSSNTPSNTPPAYARMSSGSNLLPKMGRPRYWVNSTKQPKPKTVPARKSAPRMILFWNSPSRGKSSSAAEYRSCNRS